MLPPDRDWGCAAQRTELATWGRRCQQGRALRTAAVLVGGCARCHARSRCTKSSLGCGGGRTSRDNCRPSSWQRCGSGHDMIHDAVPSAQMLPRGGGARPALSASNPHRGTVEGIVSSRLTKCGPCNTSDPHLNRAYV